MSGPAFDLGDRERMTVEGQRMFRVEGASGRIRWIQEDSVLPREHWTFEGMTSPEGSVEAIFRIYDYPREDLRSITSFPLPDLPNDLIGIDDLERMKVVGYHGAA